MLKPGQKLKQRVMVDGKPKEITAVVKGVVKKKPQQPAEKQKEQ
ncbi:hypothetical protein [Gimesia algae]|uniref:Uncharacterized protein n=1 Tax=Gimesia algae TaxID=2527971 RepID=A0A517VMB1_9PLAN|nr:hypothetical protein [Gimesia algae]QDT94163.1 hypothetical protein Pan161_58560 [Gimesia algae]